MYGSMEESPPAAEAPALGPAELKAVRKLLSATSSTNGGSDVTDQPGLLHEPRELSTSTLAKLEAASDEVELQQSVWDSSLFLFNPVAGRSASLFAFLLLAVHAARGNARPDIPTPVRSLSMRRRARRRFQISGLFAIAATRAAYHRIIARMGPRGRPPVIKFVLPIPALSEERYRRVSFLRTYSMPRNRRRRHRDHPCRRRAHVLARVRARGRRRARHHRRHRTACPAGQ